MARRVNESGETLTFGVELEFYIAWESQPGLVATPERLRGQPGRPLLCDFGKEEQAMAQALAPLINSISPRGVLSSRPANPVGPRIEYSHMDNYQEWTVKYDSSLYMTDEQYQEIKPPRDRKGWQGLELVCEFLRNNFLIETPRQAGLHIHVGNGNKWFNSHSFRMIGSLIYAADPILAQMHPKHRCTQSSYSRSNRIFAAISFGATNNNIEQHPPKPDEEEEILPQILDRELEHIGNNPVRTSDSNQQRLNLGIRGRPMVGVYENITRNMGEYDEWEHTVDPQTYVPVPIAQAVREILHAPTRDAVARLLQVEETRGAYNFNAYLDEMVGKRTIEFRQPAATIESAEVLLQVNVALGVIEHACRATYNDIFKIVNDCTVAEINPAYYDIFDFLLEIGLTGEAEFLNKLFDTNLDDEVSHLYIRYLGLI